jgi:hypothetical protein
MNYGTIKVDQITFTNAGVDDTLTVSGIMQSMSGSITVTGTVQAETIIGTSTVSGATVTGNIGQFTVITGGSAGFTTITGNTVTGTTANFVSGVFSAEVSGLTVRGTTVSGAAVTGDVGSFATLTGGVVTLTSGVFGAGTAALPSISFSGDPNTGIYSPGADQVALSTNGTQRLTTDTAAVTSTLPVVHPLGAAATPSLTFTGDLNTGIYSPGADQVAVATNGTGRLFVDASGNVGVGASPTARLEVARLGGSWTGPALPGGTAAFFHPGGGNSSSPANIVIGTGNAAASEIYFADTDSISIGRLRYDHTADSLQFYVNTSERLRITSAGLVGIGTSSPSYALQVNGISAVVNPFGAFAALQTAGGVGFRWTLSNNGTFQLQRTPDGFANAAIPITVDGSDRVGIGTTSPNRALEVRSADPEQLVLTSTSGSLAGIFFNPNGTTYTPFFGATGESLVAQTQGLERARIDSSGRLGIGTSAPAQILHASAVTSGGITSLLISNPNGAVSAGAAIKLGVSPEDNTVAKFGIIHERNNAFGGGDTYFCTNYAANATEVSKSDAAITILGSSKRVGIGTTSASQRLEVAGNSLLYSGQSGYSYYCINENYGIGTPSSLGLQIFAQDADVIRFGHKNASVFTERCRLDASGRLLVGTSTSAAYGAAGLLQILGTTNAHASIARATDNSAEPTFNLAKARGSVGTPTVVVSGDSLGRISFVGHDGTDYESIGAWIRGEVDGTPGANDMPGRLVFSTTADGASSPTARIIINSSGTLYPATDNAFQAGSLGFRWTAIYAVNGTIQTSDARQKTDVSSCSLGSEFIKSLQPVSYKWIEGGNTVTKSEDGKTDVVTPVPGERTHWGFLAQDVKVAVDDAGVDFGGWILTDKNDPDSAQGLRYDQFIAPLTKALQETMAELEVLKAEVAALKAQ